MTRNHESFVHSLWVEVLHWLAIHWAAEYRLEVTWAPFTLHTMTIWIWTVLAWMLVGRRAPACCFLICRLGQADGSAKAHSVHEATLSDYKAAEWAGQHVRNAFMIEELGSNLPRFTSDASPGQKILLIINLAWSQRMQTRRKNCAAYRLWQHSPSPSSLLITCLAHA